MNSVWQGLSWAVNSKYLCFNEVGDCLPFSLTKACRGIEVQIHAFLIAAIVVREWLISHSRISNCGGRVSAIEMNSSPVFVMDITDPNLISPRILGRSHKIFYHTPCTSYSGICGVEGANLTLCIYIITVVPPVSTGNTFQDQTRLRETADNTYRYIYYVIFV
jgi:hypothetical protein